jgi:hypothetical protein
MTDEPVTRGEVDKFLPSQFSEIVVKGWRSLSTEDKKRLSGLVSFKSGEN